MEATRGRPEAVDAVKVVVRVRPLNAKERQEQTKSCVRIAASPDGLSSNNRADASGPQQLIVGKDRAFTFDEVFGIDSSQQDVYCNNVEPLVDCFLDGYNATVLAYGQTGTGKTHTMSGSSIGPKSGSRGDDFQGIIPRVIRAIFEKMQTNQQHKEYSLRIEYIEIYNEELRDLLHPETPSKQLSIREDADGNIIMAGVKSETAPTKEAVLRLLSLGGASRVTGSTLMNEQSSRSHAIFSLLVQQRDLTTGDCRKAKFHLVDLAGSERAKRTGAVAGRFKESISINQGLLALGNVISALSDEKRKLGEKTSSGGVHVPYRDSKLTRLLQDSLGGNAKTLMIACVSPATVNFEETLNTLKYANRAKNIKNRPIVNQQSAEEKQRNDDEIARMKEEIALLQSQLQVTTRPVTPSTASSSSSRPETASSSSSSVSSSRHRRHSVAVSTSTVITPVDDQELVHLRKKCRAYVDTIETMRGLSVDAITSLVAMERDIKPLGRPVQQRLNEIVKMLNAAVQAVGSVESSLRKSPSVVIPGDASETTAVHERMAKELNDAKANLARDEQIFEMKNSEIQRLHVFVTEAKVKNEKLIERVQELERKSHLWASPTIDEGRQSRSTGKLETSSGEALANQADADAKRSTSSRGLFTKRGAGTAMGFEPLEDNVVIGTDDDDETSAVATSKSREKGLQSSHFKSTTVRRVGPPSSHRNGVRESQDETVSVSKMDKMLATLRGRVEELQQQNSELQHGREEAFRRWQFERQQYERAINDGEQTIEALRSAKQQLEDTLLEDKHEALPPPQPTPRKTSPKEIVLHEQDIVGDQQTATPTEVMELYDTSVRRLIEYNHARQQVLQLVKDKKAAQHNVDEASRRLNALEMHKMRQSLSLRESIADVTASLRHINEKIETHGQHDCDRTVDEIARLAKLKDRAERKLKTLRRQEAREEFIDKDTQQEIVDLEELIEDLNSHIAFQDAELVAAREEMALVKNQTQQEQQSPVDSLAQAVVDRLGLRDPLSRTALALVKKCLEDVARLRAREQDLLGDVHERQAAVAERDAALGQLEVGLSAARKEFDRRLQLQMQESQQLAAELEAHVTLLTAAAETVATNRETDRDKLQLQPQLLEPEHSSRRDDEWQKIIISCQKKDEYITDLEKHVVFYKAKAKQMQGQLQQLIRDSAAGNQDDHSSGSDHEAHEENRQLQQRIQQLEDANNALMKDLATAKVYLRSSKSRSSTTNGGGTQIVRISKSELREMPQPPTAVTSRDDD